MDTLRIGFAGGGIIADAHASCIAELDGQKVVAVAEPVDRVREGLAARYSIPRTYKSWEELVADLEIDVVYVNAPNDLHLPIAAAAMEAGKDVICEKPLARTVAEGRAMIQKSRQTGRKLFISLNQRFRPSHQKAKQMIAQGAIGRPFFAMSTFVGNEFARMNDPANWKGTFEKSGGGVLIDNGTHMIDLLRWWLGDAVAATARCGQLAVQAENKAEDTAIVTIEFESGALAELSGTFGARYSVWPKGYVGAAIRTEIYAMEGAIKAGNDDPPFEMVKSDGASLALADSEITTGMPASAQAHFADCIRGLAEPIVTVEDGLAALEIVEAAYLSAREGRRVAIAEIKAQG